MAKELLFSRKKLQVIHPNLTFIGTDIHSFQFQKHLGLVLDSKLNFDLHLKKIYHCKYWYTFIKENEIFFT